MNKIILSDFFNSQELERIQTYIRHLNIILQEKDIAIFMARKAICFYDALVKNGEIKENKCHITTNRIFTFNASYLKDKEVVLLDDVVVQGITLTNAIQDVKKFTDKFEVYVLAIKEENIKNINFKGKIISNPQILNDDVLTLSNSITNYITASNCSYNIDFPVFTSSISEEIYETIRAKTTLKVISNKIHDNYYIDVQIQSCSFIDEDLCSLSITKDMIFKVRFSFDKKNSLNENCLIVPIVLFPPLNATQINKLFGCIVTSPIIDMVNSETESLRNKFKLIQYYFSYKLLFAILPQLNFDIEIKYSEDKQDWLFPHQYHESIKELFIKPLTLPKIKLDYPQFNFFDISIVYKHLLNWVEFHNKDHRIKFSIETLIKENNDLGYTLKTLRQLISVALDIAIDIGYIVPEIIFEEGSIKRVYRLSEKYALTEKHFDLFVYMLYKFNKLIKGDEPLDKTLVEKLCVLFFKSEIPALATLENVTEDNMFEIHLTKFGPMVASGANIYEVIKEKSLTYKLKHLYKNMIGRDSLIEINKKYEFTGDLKFENLDDSWKLKADNFSENYRSLYCIYNDYAEKNNDKLSFIRFITLKSIGNSRRNKILSILAELNIFKTNLEYYNREYYIKNGRQINLIQLFKCINWDGLESGAWKYMHFKKDTLKHINTSLNAYYNNLENEIKANDIQIKKLEKEIQIYKKQKNDKLTKISLINTQIESRPDKPNSKNLTMLSITKNLQNLKKEANLDLSDDELRELDINLTSQYMLKLYKENNELDCIIEKIQSDLNNAYQQDAKLVKRKLLYNRYKITEDVNVCKYSSEINLLYDNYMEEAVYLLYEILKYALCRVEQNPKEYKFIKFENKGEVESFVSYIEEKNKKIFFDDDKLIFSRFEEIASQVGLLLDKFDNLINKDLKGYSSLKNVFLIKQDYGEDINDKNLLNEKAKNYQIEKYLNIDENNSTCIITDINEQKIELVNNLKNCTIVLLKSNKEYNKLLITNSFGEGFNTKFKNTILACLTMELDASSHYIISETDRIEEYNINYKDNIIFGLTLKNIQKENFNMKEKILIVHGHDEELKLNVARMLEKADLDPIILHERANAGQTIIEKFESNSDVAYAVVLYTGCDLGKSTSDKKLKPRARQNVVFEHGYLLSKLGRDKVCALVKGDVELPSDINGVLYVKIDENGAWKIDIAKELIRAGIEIDANKLVY